jgi:hypothetical protein
MSSIDIDTIIKDGYEKGLPVSQIALQVGRHKSNVLARAKKMGLQHPHSGGSNYNKVENTILNMGIDPNQVDHGWIKTEEASIHFVNTLVSKTVEDHLREIVERMQKYAPRYKEIKYKKIKDPHMQLLDVADLHIGKFALSRDGKQCYDIEKAVYFAEKGVEILLNRTQHLNTELFIFPIGNDIIHVDSKSNTTTRGTRQDVSGHWVQMIDAAVQMYVRILEDLSQIAPVHVVYNRSNHDEHSGYLVAREVRAWMSRNRNISFTITNNDREYIRYGRSMIGLDHGDGAKTNEIISIMASESPQMWGDTIYRYFIRHHVHHFSKKEPLSGKDFPGATVLTMRSLSPSDDWHQKMGYVGAPQALDTVIFSKEYGLIDLMSCVFSDKNP